MSERQSSRDKPQHGDRRARDPIKGVSDLVAAGLVAEEDAGFLAEVERHLRVAITPTLLEAMAGEGAGGALRRQFIPDPRELNVTPGERADPIGDQAHTPVPGVVHRYRDRVLLMPLHICSVYCRFCFRREVVGGGEDAILRPAALAAALDYIGARPDIWEVILTGGDPLVLAPGRLGAIVRALDTMEHVEVIRIHTRIPLVSPERVDEALLEALRARTAVYVVVHANHASEITDPGREALARLSGAGIPLLSQTVLLRGVNDTQVALTALMRRLVANRVKPYYLHQLDLARGTGHFRVPIAEGQALVRGMRGAVSGLCQPTYVLDIPGGLGKVPIGPRYLADAGEGGVYEVEDVSGARHRYVEPPADPAAPAGAEGAVAAPGLAAETTERGRGPGAV